MLLEAFVRSSVTLWYFYQSYREHGRAVLGFDQDSLCCTLPIIHYYTIEQLYNCTCGYQCITPRGERCITYSFETSILLFFFFLFLQINIHIKSKIKHTIYSIIKLCQVFRNVSKI